MRKDKNVLCRVHIKEVPYQLYKYTVVRATEHEFWFYATYDKLDDAIKSAESVPNGYVLQTKGVR
jgi:hypothetical protein